MLDGSLYSYLIQWSNQFSNTNGVPIAAGYIEIYEAGTSNKYISYADFTGAENPFRIPLDSTGRCVAIVLRSGYYDIYVYNRIGNLEYTRLNVNGADGGNGDISGLVRTITPNSTNVHTAVNSTNADGTIEYGISVDEQDLSNYQEKLTAGDNINIDPVTNVISATDTTYEPGTGIKIEGGVISIDTDADLQIDYWTGRSSEIDENNLNANMYLSRSRGDKIYLDDGKLYVKPGTYIVNAFVKINNANSTLDGNLYRFDIYGGVLGGDPRLVLDFDNSLIHTQEYSLTFLTVNPNNTDMQIELGTNAALQIAGLRVALEYVQVYCVNGLGGSSSGGGSGGNTYILTSNDHSVTISESTVADVTTYDLSVSGFNQQQADWTENDSDSVSYIKHKPNLAAVATSGSYNDLSNTPTIPAPQVNADWNAVSGVSAILNKPSIPTVGTIDL